MSRSKLLTAALIFFGCALLLAMVAYGQEPEIEFDLVDDRAGRGRRALRWLFEPLPGEKWAVAGAALDAGVSASRVGRPNRTALGNGQFLDTIPPHEQGTITRAMFGRYPSDAEYFLAQPVQHYLLARPLARGLCGIVPATRPIRAAGLTLWPRPARRCHKAAFGALGAIWTLLAAEAL